MSLPSLRGILGKGEMEPQCLGLVHDVFTAPNKGFQREDGSLSKEGNG